MSVNNNIPLAPPLHPIIGLQYLNREKTVMLVKDATNTHFIIKDIPTFEASQEDQFLQKFPHQNIIRLVSSDTGSFRDKYRVRMCLEYAPQGDFYSLVESNKLSEEKIHRYAVQLFDALKHLHSNNVVHRDLKLENIFVFPKDLLKIGDLGFAKQIQGDCAELGYCGSLPWLAPEVLELKRNPNQKGVYGKAADHWSMGALLYTMATQRLPFKTPKSDVHNEKIILNYLDQTLKTASIELPKGLSEEFKDLVARLLTIDPEKRLGHNGCDEIFEHAWFQKMQGNVEEKTSL